MAGIGAILLIVTVLLAAPLVLGSFIMAQRSSQQALVTWFGLLTLLLILGLAAGAFALLTAPL